MNDKIEVEFRVRIPITDFKKFFRIISAHAKIRDRKKRFAIMLFMNKEDNHSVLYLRTTKDMDRSTYYTELVHKRGERHAVDRAEISQEIDEALFENLTKLLATLPTERTLVVQREIVNFQTTDGIVISLVRAVYNAYIEFEILCNKSEKQIQEKRLHDLIDSMQLVPLDEEASTAFFKLLDKEDDRKISGSTDDIDSVLQDYRKFKE